MQLRVAVVGAGVIGLSTAINIQDTLPGIQVDIYADKFDVETTSDGAAGIYRPSVELLQQLPEQRLRRWCLDSWCHYDSLVRSEMGPEIGISQISGYMFYNGAKHRWLFQDYVYESKELTIEEKGKVIGAQDYDHGLQFSTLLVECRHYLPYLTKRFKQNGGKIIARTINNLWQLQDYDVIVNCSGLRSRELVNDVMIRPIRGQMLRVKAPWVKQFVFTMKSWVIPGIDNVVVGGTRNDGDENLDISSSDREAILNRAAKFVPSIKTAKKEWDWVGLRPHRTPVRVELETKQREGKEIKVVHNYGHGGNGVTLSWGSAVYAAELVRAAIGSLQSNL